MVYCLVLMADRKLYEKYVPSLNKSQITIHDTATEGHQNSLVL